MKEFSSSPNLRDPRGFSARVAQKNGFTLVELLVSTLILVIVATGWFTIMNATSPYREAQRRAAIEVAAGVLDTFFPAGSPYQMKLGYYKCKPANGENDYPFEPVDDDSLQKFPENLFPADSTIRYRLHYMCAAGNVSDPANTVSAGDPRNKMWNDLRTQFNEYHENQEPLYSVRIEVFDSEQSDSPLAVFEQLIGMATYDPRAKLPGIKGY